MRILRLWLAEVRVRTGVLALRLLTGLILSCTLSNITLAQDPNNNYCSNPQGAELGGFILDKTRICVGSAVTINTGSIPSGLANIGYIKEYNGKGIPSNFEVGPSFQYTKPGSYTILQVGTVNGSRALSCQTVDVLPLDPIDFTVKSCSGNKVTIVPDVSTLGNYDVYTVNWNDGSPVEELSRAQMAAALEHTYGDVLFDKVRITVEGVYGTILNPICKSPTLKDVNLKATATQPVITALTTVDDKTITLQYQASAESAVQLYQKVNGTYVTIPQSGTGTGSFRVSTDAKQVQCFQVVAQGACDGDGLKSDEVCSLVLDAKATNKKNILSWQPYVGTFPGGQFRYYRLTRDNAPMGGTLTDRAANSYIDDDNIQCGQPYCYALVATVAGSLAQTEITSAPICVTGINGDAPDSIGAVIVSVENNHPTLTTTLASTGSPASYTLLISRADGGSGAFQPIGTVVDTTGFVDSQTSASAGSYCYQVTYRGACGITLPPTKPVCSVFLNASTKTSLDWTEGSPFTSGPVTNYTVEVTDPVTGATRIIAQGTSLHYEADPNDLNAQSYTYRIIATDGGNTSYSNYFTLQGEANILVPDVFTPNGDQMNDEFLPKGIFTERFLMTIYSRWGTVIYSTTDKSKGWDGTVNGQSALDGQYMYRIEIEGPTGQKTVRTGALLLIR